MGFKEAVHAAVIIGITTACGPKPVETPTPVPAKVTVKPTIETQPSPTLQIEIAWDTLSPTARIQRIESGMIPEQRDSFAELTKATAEFFVSEVKSPLSAEKLAEGVHVLPIDEFVAQYEIHQKKKLTPNEKQKLLKQQLEFTTSETTKEVFINAALFTTIVNEIRTNQPDFIRRLRGKTLDHVLFKSLLLHAFTHLHESQKEYTFPPFSLKLPGEPGPINFDRMIGFTFVGETQDGRRIYINGLKEAATEITSKRLGGKVLPYITITEHYAHGEYALNSLNELAKISPEEFEKYRRGLTPLDEYLLKLGSLKNRTNPDRKAGVLALATIGLGTDLGESREKMQESMLFFLLPQHPR